MKNKEPKTQGKIGFEFAKTIDELLSRHRCFKNNLPVRVVMITELENILKLEKSAQLQRVIELIGELEKTITQMGVDPERRLNPDENDIKREMHNKGRAFGYTEALYDLKTKISQMGEELC